MVNLGQTLALVLCFLQLPYFTAAFFRGSGMRKRFSLGSRSRPRSYPIYSDISFMSTLPDEMIVHRHESVVLECEAQAIPAPTIHWLRNGVRLPQGYSNSVMDEAANYEDHPSGLGKRMIGVSSTKSRLSLDCVTARNQGQYTCVAETPFLKLTQNTTVKVARRRDFEDIDDVEQCVGRAASRVEPARIFMWSVSRIEYEGVKVQLFCRAQGIPQPTVTWYDRNNEPIENDEEYEVLDNGDLIIKSISWRKNMGVYTCLADNGLSTDTSTAFLYPAARD